MKSRYFTILAVTAALSLAPAMLAQDSSPHADGGSAAGGQPQPRIENFDFPGGPVVRYIDRIREAIPEANFVATREANQFYMPPMKLRNVPLPQLAALIGETAQPVEGRGTIYAKPIGGNVYAVQAMIHPPGRERSEPELPVESLVISLADVITDELRDAHDIFMAIETALEFFSGDYPQARLRYHEPTKLLIARGHPNQMESIRNIVGELRGAVRAQYGTGQIGPQTTRMISDLRARVRDLEHQNTSLEAALNRCLEDRETSPEE